MPTHVAIVGNGVAGITAARFLRKASSDVRLTVISAETEHFYSRTALMYIYMGHMTYEETKPYEDWFWEKNRIALVYDYVETIDVEKKTLQLREGAPLAYDILILATGSKPRSIGMEGEDLEGVQGLYGIPDLEAMEDATDGIDRAVVAGGGLIGVELAEMLHTRHIPVTFLVRESNYYRNVLPPEEATIVTEAIRGHDIDLRLSTELDAIHGNGNGRVEGITTNNGERIDCQFLGITIGVTPNLAVTEGTPIKTNRGILVDERFRTNVPNVYAVGDCTEFVREGIGYRTIDQLWYTGRKEGQAVARIITGDTRGYAPGPFFNSAKFFNVEYQTYGTIAPDLPEDQETLCWQHPSKPKLIRINYERESERVVGFNLMGVRYRQDVCHRWLAEERTIREILPKLEEANFDREFDERYEAALRAQYRERFPDVVLQA